MNEKKTQASQMSALHKKLQIKGPVLVRQIQGFAAYHADSTVIK